MTNSTTRRGVDFGYSAKRHGTDFAYGDDTGLSAKQVRRMHSEDGGRSEISWRGAPLNAAELSEFWALLRAGRNFRRLPVAA